jgi:autoinducer 2-degrading protein
MITAVVTFHVKDKQINRFKEISQTNAQASRKEPGIKSFEVLQQMDDDSKFLFIETYVSLEDQLSHRETTHYKLWKSQVEELLAQPRTNVKYTVIEK